MIIVKEFPPLIEAIDAEFSCRNMPVIYAWGDKIYNPHGTSVSPALQMHEAVHGVQQAGNPEAWWVKYIADKEFRLAQEVPAHRAELKWHRSQPDAYRPCIGFRTQAAYFEHQIAKRLSAPLYGSLVTLGQARKMLNA